MKFEILLLFIFLLSCTACKKLVGIAPPINSITTEETFADSADANSAILGIYTQAINTNGNSYFTDGAISLAAGLSADELVNFSNPSNIHQVYTNSLTEDNGYVYNYLWSQAYTTIYQANVCIEGLEKSSDLSTATKLQLISEAKFIRSLFYFYLINLFGDVPFITSTDFAHTSHQARNKASDIYNQLISDLQVAESDLPSDYAASGGARTRANKWCAKALLARIYLFTKDYSNAEKEASDIIDGDLFNLSTNLNEVFLVTSTEAILQWQINGYNSPVGNATPEGCSFVPSSSTSSPMFYLSQQLLNAFETDDKRKGAWIDSTQYAGNTYYYPYKYKIGYAQEQTGSAVENYMVLRLAEQYLIRAEARAQLGNTAGAVADLNVIRLRSGLTVYGGLTTQAPLLSAIIHERQVELFAEWGHRWFDLKRTGAVDQIMTVVTPQKIGGGTWENYQQLYPMPYQELKLNPSLTQNSGY